jgi:hypothetical protein
MKNAAVILFLCLVSTSILHSEGFTVTSVSTSSIITRTTQPASVYWIINANFNGGGQSLTGTLDPNTVKSFMGGKVYTKQPFSVSVNSMDETIFYEVVNEGVQVYKYSYYTEDNPTTLGVATADPAPCSNSNWQIDIGRTTFGYVDMRFCVKKEVVAVKGAYNNPKIDFKAKISVSNGYQTIERQVCSGASAGCMGASVDLSEIGTAQWTGSLVTGDSPPNQNLFVAIGRHDNSKWQIAGEPYWSDYKNKESVADGLLNDIRARATQGRFTSSEYISQIDASIQSAISPPNQAEYVLLNQDASFTSSPFTKDSNSGKISVTLGRRLTSPNVVFKIRADWIGIVIPTGKPKIISAIANTLKSGESGEVRVQIQNIGEGDGTFSTILMGCEPFVQTSSGESARQTIQPNNVNTISIGISGGASTDAISKSCTVKVYDVNDPTIYDQYSLYLQQQKPRICVPNQIIAEGSIIKKCNNGGTSLDIVDNCQYGVLSDNRGGFECASPPPNTQGQATSSNATKTRYQCDSDSDCDSLYRCNLDYHLCVQRSGCMNVINNGDSNKKADVVFVGDGFATNDELKQTILKIARDDPYSFMQVEPFKSNQNKFNIWMINAGNGIPHDANGYPNWDPSIEKASECSMAEYQVVLSKSNFRSFAVPSINLVMLSLTYSREQFWAVVLTHEFGHSIGKLADEYVEPALGNRPHAPNCAPDTSTAQSWWGGVPGTGYFPGCSYVDANVRPTENSIMRNCYVPTAFGPVNEAYIRTMLNKYG